MLGSQLLELREARALARQLGALAVQLRLQALELAHCLRLLRQLLVLLTFVIAQFLVFLRDRLERAAQPDQLRVLQLRARQRRRLRRLALLPLARLSEQIWLWRRRLRALG